MAFKPSAACDRLAPAIQGQPAPPSLIESQAPWRCMNRRRPNQDRFRPAIKALSEGRSVSSSSRLSSLDTQLVDGAVLPSCHLRRARPMTQQMSGLSSVRPRGAYSPFHHTWPFSIHISRITDVEAVRLPVYMLTRLSRASGCCLRTAS